MDQLMFAAYVTLITALTKEALVITNLLNFSSTMDYQTFLQFNTLINCISIPSYWIYSTRKDFHELWSIETCFWKTKNTTLQETIEVQMVPLEPRRPSSCKVFSANERGQQEESTRASGRFSFGFRSNLTLQ